MIKKDLCRVERRKETGKTGVNEPILQWVTVLHSLNCDIQPDNSDVSMPEAGQTVIVRKTMYCGPVDVREKDRITDLRTGLQFFVRQVQPFNLITHLEVKMESGQL